MEEQRARKRTELILVFTVFLAATGVALGTLVAFFDILGYASVGRGLQLVGMLALSASMLVSFDIDTLRILFRQRTGGTRYDQLKRWTRLKAGALFLNLMIIFGFILLVIAFLSRFDVIEVDQTSMAVKRILALLVFAIIGAITYSHWESLAVPLDRDRNAMHRVYNGLGAAIGAFLGIFAYILPGLQTGFGPFQPQDGPFLTLTGLTALAITVFVSRGLPTPYTIFGAKDTAYRGRTYFSRGKSVLMPTLTAFGLLFILLFIFLIFGVEVAGELGAVFKSTLVLGMLGFLAVAMMVSFAASLMLARQEDKPILYRKQKTEAEKYDNLIIGSSATVATILFGFAFYLGTIDTIGGLKEKHWLDFMAIGLLVAVGPMGFYRAHRSKQVRKLEERFPDFLRDLASSHKGGLTLAASVQVASKGDYGALTPEIHKMADQLSWNVPFEEALARFADRVNTPGVQRTVSLILEASRSGGNTIDVLTAAGRDAREIKNLENQRRLTMSLYTTVIYITFFVFLVVVAILFAQFVPEILRASEAAKGAGEGGGVGGMSFNTPTENQFRQFYFIAAVVQGMGDGIVAGLMGSGEFSMGLRHSFIMVLIAYLTFALWLV